MSKESACEHYKDKLGLPEETIGTNNYGYWFAYKNSHVRIINQSTRIFVTLHDIDMGSVCRAFEYDMHMLRDTRPILYWELVEAYNFHDKMFDMNWHCGLNSIIRWIKCHSR
jgi:hypothetical protein